MSFDVSQCNNATAEIAAAEAYSSVFRIMTVGGQDNTPSSPAVDLNATAQPWEALSSATAGDFSAVCWFAARDAYDSLVAAGAGAIPFGLISNNVGGTSIELWSRGSDLATCANTSAAPYGPPYSNGVLFNGMVAPFTTGPTAMAVWLFYQAEANVSAAHQLRSRTQSPHLAPPRSARRTSLHPRGTPAPFPPSFRPGGRSSERPPSPSSSCSSRHLTGRTGGRTSGRRSLLRSPCRPWLSAR